LDTEAQGGTSAFSGDHREKATMGLRITTLSENTASMDDFIAEWGLSILIETEKTKILFDTGQGYACVHNADTLGIDLRDIDKIVLSHGHFDHTGGLRDVLRRIRKKIEIIAHPHIWQPKYSLRRSEEPRYIGIPFCQNELESLGARFILDPKPAEIDGSIMTTGEIPMSTSYEEVDAALFIKEDSGWKPDRVMDDQALVIKTDAGLVIILGCAHRGMVNTICHARQLAGEERIRALIGGSHLITASAQNFRQTVDDLRKLGNPKLGLCHCTDLKAIGCLSQEFGENFIFNKAGSIIEFD
jgi:7,8-dihydropterin-6-yl-methyl-4-(beta-D-ribofuranosyl)aminobenzene 5'-phosphate synthase